MLPGPRRGQQRLGAREGWQRCKPVTRFGSGNSIMRNRALCRFRLRRVTSLQPVDLLEERFHPLFLRKPARLTCPFPPFPIAPSSYAFFLSSWGSLLSSELLGLRLIDPAPAFRFPS